MQDRPRQRIVRAGALYDLIVIGPLALPGLATIQLKIMFWLNGWLGLPGGGMPEFAPVEMLFVNMFGLVAMIWISLRLFRYEARFCYLDMVIRGLASVLLAYYALTQQVHGLIWVFLFFEMAFLCVYSIAIKRGEAVTMPGQASL
ncbi:MAG: hypothetical protein ACRCU5_10515 [Rhizobiaceae bacterium]